MDPISILTAAGLGLKLVDQFRELVLRWRGGRVEPPSATVVPVPDGIRIEQRGAPPQTVKPDQVRLDQWDEQRYRALDRRVRLNWEYFNELYAQQVGLAADETARLNVRMNRTKEELCSDFREMVRIYERALNVRLPDHYQLYEVCG